LCQTQPKRQWNFIAVDVHPTEISQWKSHVAKLISPKNTLMDITIATALWFAARGEGTVTKYRPNFVTYTERTYRSISPVLLLGHGADELMGGYGRHRTSFKIGGWDKLKVELDKDIKRFWSRNLGRDDRVISDHGREARHPFLDENFMRFLGNLPLWNICDFSLKPGEGEKKILRECAKKLGLSSAYLPKRAIQFGSRISLHFPKIKGTDTDWE